MKLGIGAPRSTASFQAEARLFDTIDRFANGDVILIDTAVTRFTFIVGDAATNTGTLAGGDLYDPVAALLVGSVRERGREGTVGLRVAGTALFYVDAGASGYLQRIPVERLSRLTEPPSPV
jgi:hypothetical protein